MCRSSSQRWSPRFRHACLLLAASLATSARAGDFRYLAYVGTYTGQGSQGIYVHRFDPASGESSALGLAAATDNPSFLAAAADGRFLYAVNEVDTFDGRPTGAVSAFAVDRGSGRLRRLQQASSLGAGPAHLSLDRSGRFLMVANYGGGSVAVFPVRTDGRLGPASAFVQDAGSSVNPERQAGPHAHYVQATGDNRLVVVADLGLDRLLVHRLDGETGSLKPATPAFAAVQPGAGPRHLAFAPSGKVAYVVNELASTVTVLELDPGAGTLRGRQTISTLPGSHTGGMNTAAEIALDASGRHLYVSNRGHDSIAVFGVDPGDGRLRPLEWVASGGRTPRHFTLDPSGRWLLVANQDSNVVRLFRVDPASGRLTATARSWNVVSPVCVLLVSAR